MIKTEMAAVSAFTSGKGASFVISGTGSRPPRPWLLCSFPWVRSSCDASSRTRSHDVSEVKSSKKIIGEPVSRCCPRRLCLIQAIWGYGDNTVQTGLFAVNGMFARSAVIFALIAIVAGQGPSVDGSTINNADQQQTPIRINESFYKGSQNFALNFFKVQLKR